MADVEHEQVEHTIKSLPPVGGVLEENLGGAADAGVDLASAVTGLLEADGDDKAALVQAVFDLAESVRSESAPEVHGGLITVMTTLPNAVATGRVSGELGAGGYPLWLKGTHWTPVGGVGIQCDDLDCTCATPQAELPDLVQTKPPCDADKATAFRLASRGFDKRCVPVGAWSPREKLERQTSLGLAGNIATNVIARAKATGFEDDGVTRLLEDDGVTELPTGDASGGKCLCIHKGFGTLRSSREYRGDGTLGVLVITSMLQDYLTVEKPYVIRVQGPYGPRWETQAGEPVVFAPANKLTGPNGEAGLWMYSTNAVDWILTDIEALSTGRTKQQVLGNRDPEPHQGRYGMTRVDSPETYAVCVVAGCESCEEDVTP